MAATGGRGTTILAVDDRPDNLFSLEKVITDRLPGCTVLTAESADAGLSIADDTPIDAALIDVQMPHMDGIEMCRHLKANSATAYIPVILMTAHGASPTQKAIGLDAGADDFINKPIDNTELAARLSAVLRVKTVEDQLRRSAARLTALADRRTRQLADSESYYRSLIYNLHEDVIVINEDYVITDVNNSFLVSVGRNAEDVIGRHCYKISHGFDNPCEQYGEACPLRVVFNTGIPSHCQHTRTDKDGAKVHVDILVSPVTDDSGTVTHAVEAIRDITELMEAQEQLQANEAQLRLFRDLVDQSNDAIYVVEPETGRFLDVSRGACQSLGYAYEELLEMAVPDIVPALSDDAALREYVEELRACGSLVREGEHRRKDGGTFLVEVSISLGKWGDREYIVVTAHDITQRKKTEEALKKQRHYLSRAQEIGNIGTWELDIAKNELFWTDENYRIFGLPTGTELTYETFLGCVHPDDGEYVDVKWKEAMAGEPYDIEHRLLVDGQVKWVREKAELEFDDAGNCIRGTGVTQDITEQKLAEEALRESEMMNRSLLEGSPVCNKIIDLDSKLRYMSAAGVKHLKIPDIQPYYGQTYPPEFYPESMRAPLVKGLELAKAGEVSCVEAPVHDTEGNEVWYHTTFVPALNDDDQVKYVIGSSVNITERKRAEEQHRQDEHIVANATDMLALVDRRYVYLAANAAYLRAVVKTPDEVIGRTVSEVLGEELFETVIKPRADICLSGEDIRYQDWFDFQSAGRRYMDIAYSPYRGPDGGPEGFVVSGRDITEQRDLEAQFRQAQKMEAVGQLAGGVAHDFRNQLTVIQGYASMLLREAVGKEQDQERLGVILEAVNRATTITNQLLVFSRKESLHSETTDLNDSLKDLSKLLHQMVGEDVRLLTVYSPDACCADIDPGLFQQAIMNLVVNARHAMPDGGELTIEIAPVELDRKDLQGNPNANPGPYAMAIVSDTGTGMDPETLAKVFDPFFTTKEVGMGTGMGLAMVYGFVAQSGGVVSVGSELGEGSVFRLHFPLAPRLEESAAPTLTPESEGLPQGSETILVVEDEEAVRHMIVSLLRECGYTVLEAGNAAEALPLGEHYEHRIDLLVTDVVMPKMNGLEMSQRLKGVRPDMAVMFISGYDDSVVSQSVLMQPATELLTKPINTMTLAQTVRRMLDKANLIRKQD